MRNKCLDKSVGGTQWGRWGRSSGNLFTGMRKARTLCCTHHHFRGSVLAARTSEERDGHGAPLQLVKRILSCENHNRIGLVLFCWSGAERIYQSYGKPAASANPRHKDLSISAALIHKNQGQRMMKNPKRPGKVKRSYYGSVLHLVFSLCSGTGLQQKE